jgi:hypothetical protein
MEVQMRTFFLTVFVSFSLMLVSGCGGSKSLQSASECDVPDWYNNIPQDPNYLFAANTATSQDLQLAVDKATAGGRTEISRQVDVKISGLQKKFDEEVGVSQDAQLLQQYTDVKKLVVSNSLTGSRVKYQKQCKDGSIWRSYVLVEYPIGAPNQALIEAIKKNEQMYTRFQSSKSFKELDEEVAKYEDLKKQQGEK